MQIFIARTSFTKTKIRAKSLEDVRGFTKWRQDHIIFDSINQIFLYTQKKHNKTIHLL